MVILKCLQCSCVQQYNLEIIHNNDCYQWRIGAILWQTTGDKHTIMAKHSNIDVNVTIKFIKKTILMRMSQKRALTSSG